MEEEIQGKIKRLLEDIWLEHGLIITSLEPEWDFTDISTVLGPRCMTKLKHIRIIAEFRLMKERGAG